MLGKLDASGNANYQEINFDFPEREVTWKANTQNPAVIATPFWNRFQKTAYLSAIITCNILTRTA